ncbi:MAG: DUF2889 domain-containing protein [Reyranellaceae bacterium]
MPLPAPVERQHLHTRLVECRGYFRHDGLWDIEGHITDLKTYEHRTDYRGVMRPEDPIHEMWIRLTVDDKYVIHDVEAVSDHTPYRICPEATPNFKRLIGASIGPGFRKELRKRIPGRDSCVHIAELLGPVATVAFQTIFSERAKELMRDWRRRNGVAEPDPGPRRRPVVLDTCHTWSSDSEVVRRVYPEFYTGDDEGNVAEKSADEGTARRNAG